LRSINTLLTKHNLKVNSSYTQHRNKIKQDAIDGYKTCPKCGIKKELNKINYYIKKTGKIHSWCKECNNKIIVEKQNQLKQKSVDYKGGKCSVCGYNKCLAALEFHHISPDKKEFEISRYRTYSFNTLAPELDKCLLLCSNCHKELHDKQNKERMVAQEGFPPPT
jgi:hypothetical protein